MAWSLTESLTLWRRLYVRNSAPILRGCRCKQSCFRPLERNEIKLNPPARYGERRVALGRTVRVAHNALAAIPSSAVTAASGKFSWNGCSISI